ncbi:Rv1733c family protein [Pseudonocardia abyssalis]|uniref:Integral membrane protein n=1 Tax=Pseudonocardia abyssalis TaxID=2792008 RepID=A0ABS6UPG5_9PSEU|nr:hypothetical protein [Pseudonocardia abyssalis]MBW0118579.1 hypothetical protein [Pseudonocardia abyssalis]MBW0133798.1 hypothetical protein [Pseudonocardia abyssalis]
MTRRQRPADGRTARAGRRFTDVLEDLAAWILTSAGAFVLVAAILSGFAAHADAALRVREERATRTTAEAVLLTDAPVVRGAKGSAPGRVRVEARWTAPDGSLRTGQVSAAAGAPAGSPVTVWVDRDGRTVAPPADEAGAMAVGGIVAGGLLLIGGLVLGSCWAGVRLVTGRVNAARWEREWARVGPEWSGERR